ncbi:MAG: tetratricopeptide repeat protein [Thermoguttaceae bacterium]
MKLLQASGDERGVTQTCNLLGVVEQNQGRLAEARAWYSRSREIARSRKDAMSLGVAAQNLGFVCQQEGQAARPAGDETVAARHFAAAEQFLRECLSAWTETGDQPHETSSQGHLGRLYCLIGRLEEAEQHAQRTREIGEGLHDLRGLSITYQTVRQINRARGDESTVPGWAEKEQAIDPEVARRARGGDDSGPDARLLEMWTNLLVACVKSSVAGVPLPAGTAELLDQLDSPAAGALAPLGRYLRQFATAAASDLPALPTSAGPCRAHPHPPRAIACRALARNSYPYQYSTSFRSFELHRRQLHSPTLRIEFANFR